MAATYKKRDATTSISATVEELSAGMARTNRTNPSLRDTAPVSMIKLHPQERLLRGGPILRSSLSWRDGHQHYEALGLPHNVTSLFDPAMRILPIHTSTRTIGGAPEAVNHRRHHRNCRSNNNLENFWAGLVSHWEPCQLHQRAVLPRGIERDAESPAGKETMNATLHPGRKRPQPSQVAKNGKYVKRCIRLIRIVSVPVAWPRNPSSS
ncbi:hypothetical protein TcBrA4_0069750 [Trypanosoma cruzi]|nr:hypothetical protein TcBrA4_0069750 [Trypanosoma cruzi]